VAGWEKFQKQKRTEISAEKRAEKGQTKRMNLGWHRDRKATWMVHWWVLLHSAQNMLTDPLASIHALRKACFVFYVNNFHSQKAEPLRAEPLHCQGSLCLATLEARFRCLVCCCLSSLVVVKDRN
jgi:hypothetical protein